MDDVSRVRVTISWPVFEVEVEESSWRSFVNVGGELLANSYARLCRLVEALDPCKKIGPAADARSMKIRRRGLAYRSCEIPYRCKPRQNIISRDRRPCSQLTTATCNWIATDTMKLDSQALRHLTAEDWRVLTAVSPFCHVPQPGVHR